MVTHSNILAQRIPRTEEPGGLQSIGWQRVGLSTNRISFNTKPCHLKDQLSLYDKGRPLFLVLFIIMKSCRIFKKKKKNSKPISVLEGPQFPTPPHQQYSDEGMARNRMNTLHSSIFLQARQITEVMKEAHSALSVLLLGMAYRSEEQFFRKHKAESTLHECYMHLCVHLCIFVFICASFLG